MFFCAQVDCENIRDFGQFDSTTTIFRGKNAKLQPSFSFHFSRCYKFI